MISIVLADDHQVVRRGLKALLGTEPDFEIIGEAGDGLETVDLVIKLVPDILILDLMMPGINGLEVARRLNSRKIPTGIVILSMHSNEAYVLEALRSGARAYVLKDAPPEDLICAIREVIAGHYYLSSPLSGQAIKAYTNRAEVTSSDSYQTLTGKERKIFHLAAQGYSNSDIAARLLISQRTVETHRTRLMQKLGIHNQIQLAQYAVKNGLFYHDLEITG